jgi:signal peptidase
VKTFGKVVSKLLTAAVVLAVAGFVAILVVVPRVQGGAALNVLTGSMTPTIPAGSIVVVTPTAPDTIKPGDVITYQMAPGVAEYVTHRVVRVQRKTQPMSFITKGDANPGIDDPVPFGAVRGKVTFNMPYVGTASEFVRTRAGLTAIAVIPALLLVITLGKNILRELRRTSRPTEPPTVDVPAPEQVNA